MKTTALYQAHVKLDAKLVEFAGYRMPIQYRGIIQEHKRVRTSVGLFDVSHMGEFFIQGPQALDFIQSVTINDAARLEVNQAQYSAMCYPDGGIVDDLIVYRLPDRYMMIVNAGNLQKDWEWLQEHRLGGAELTNRSDEYSLLALQGPQAEATLQPLVDLDLNEIRFYWLQSGQVAGIDAIVARTGYTGEPGFEICVENRHAEKVWDALMQAGKPFEIEPVGLGARDTLRLEMKYCLYGNDIDQTTHPLEAGLGWITKLKKGEFIGREALLRVRQEGLKRKLVGFSMRDKAMPRHGYPIFVGDKQVGHVTSGTFSPMLQQGIGMGYVELGCDSIGTALEIEIRDRRSAAEIVETPFYIKS
ncbi:glycine cleavage system aminomethyltransferase GcvT [candidate division KSB1 bacterium]|nr:glycine cleavage system aminomethyltransferase GcvT [candidate division KSB1 bacterium]